MIAATPEAYKLMHDGARAFADMEEMGIRIDRAYLSEARSAAAGRISRLEERLWETQVGKEWRRHYGDKAKLDSRPQLGHILFNVMGYPCVDYTAANEDGPDEERRPATDEAALEKLDIGFVKGYLRRAKLQKLDGTYLAGLERETGDDNLLHNFFNLHTVETYRSSSSDLNFQNIPIRNPEIGKIIRSCFVARGRDWRLLEIDYAAIEVRVAACYHKDPTMLRYIRDGYDMHRDMAAECYLLPKDQVPKPVRQQAKALFVFAQFYGDYYLSCARSLWDACQRHNLTRLDGLPLVDHLRQQGITGPGRLDPDHRPVAGTYEAHIKAVEDDFWGRRFKVYAQWRRDWYEAYKRKGGFRTLTGFALNGIYSRNFVINCPVQGSAFHCLLWSVIRINREAKRRRMRSRLVGQIHDSAFADVYQPEFDDFLEMSVRIMTEELRRAWSWIITPLEVEAEASPLGGSWAEKEPIKLAA